MGEQHHAGRARGTAVAQSPGPHMTRIRDLHDHPEPFVSPEQLAVHLNVSVDTIHRAIRTGALPAVRVGPRLLRVRTEDARQFLRPVDAAPNRPVKKRPAKRGR